MKRLISAVLVMSVILLRACTPASAPPAPKPAPTPLPQPPPPPPNSATESLTYTNSEYGFSVEYPKDWDVYEDILETVCFFVGSLVVGDKINLYVTVAAYELPDQKMTLEDTVNAFVWELKKNLQGYRQEREYNTTINGVPATVLIFTHISDYGGKDVMWKENNAVLVKDKLYYLVIYSVPAEFYDEYLYAFELAIGTFKFD